MIESICIVVGAIVAVPAGILLGDVLFWVYMKVHEGK